jgi:hypothetical protein
VFARDPLSRLAHVRFPDAPVIVVVRGRSLLDSGIHAPANQKAKGYMLIFMDLCKVNKHTEDTLAHFFFVVSSTKGTFLLSLYPHV